MQIEFTGENLPPISAADITSDKPFTFVSVTDTANDQSFRLEFESAVDAVNVSFTFAGENYVCHIYRGATIEGIAYGPDNPVQPPLSETWTGSTERRAYRLQAKTDEVVLNTNWDIPPMIASTTVIVNQDDDYYVAQIDPTANPDPGNYVIKYCGQTLINVTVN